MKNLLTATLPALALLALGGCATTGAITSTEDDGVYYSSADRTTLAVAPATQRYGYETAPVQTQTTQATEDANPDYQGGTAQSGSATSDYYDNSYASASPSGFGQPYTGPGVSTYNYSPTWSVSPSFYGSPFGYGLGLGVGYGYGYGGFSGYSPFGYGYPYAGFYDPFYSPYGFGYGSGFSIGFGSGFGYPYYGGFGYPYGFGYPAYAYGYPYGRGYYGDYYGGYNRPVIYANGARSGAGNGAILVGPRGGRGGAVMSNGRANNSTMATGGGYVGSGRQGNLAPGNATANTPSTPPMYGRGEGRRATFGGGEVVGQPAYSGATTQPGATTSPVGQPAGRRGGFFREVFGGGASAAASPDGSSQPQMQQRRSYSQDGFQQRGGFNQPSYSQPSRSFEQRSFSQPAPQRSFGGGGGNFGGGGGSFGGGGGGGGRRR